MNSVGQPHLDWGPLELLRSGLDVHKDLVALDIQCALADRENGLGALQDDVGIGGGARPNEGVLGDFQRGSDFKLNSTLFEQSLRGDVLQAAFEGGVIDGADANLQVHALGQLADFGLVRVLGQEEDDWRLTRASQVMGTPQYMAPEQLNRPREVDHRADLFAFAIPLGWINDGKGPEGWLDTTYLDEDMRLGRGDKGSVFVTVRRKE